MSLPFAKIVNRINKYYQTWKANTAYYPNNLRPRLDPAIRNELHNDLFTKNVLNNIGEVTRHNYLVDMFEQIFDKRSPDSFQRDALSDFIGGTIGTTSFQNLTILASDCNIFRNYLDNQPSDLDKKISKFYEAVRDFLNGIAVSIS